eukprot:2876024-Rhodomonas_salina.5
MLTGVGTLAGPWAASVQAAGASVGDAGGACALATSSRQHEVVTQRMLLPGGAVAAVRSYPVLS